MTADQYKSEYIRDVFIRGLRNPRIRERLLENSTITLENAFDQARALELAESHSASYMNASHPMLVAAIDLPDNITKGNHSDVLGCCEVTMKLQSHVYNDVIMKNLCAEFLIGQDILKNHSLIEIQFNGERPPTTPQDLLSSCCSSSTSLTIC